MASVSVVILIEEQPIGIQAIFIFLYWKSICKSKIVVKVIGSNMGTQKIWQINK